MRKTKAKCPRCKSSRLDMRLRGEKYCKRCGQRWLPNGLLIPSFDRRAFNKDFVPEKELQLPLVKIR